MFSFGGPEAIFAQRNGMGRICVYAAIRRTRESMQEWLLHRAAKDFLREIFRAWSPNLIDLLNGCDDFVDRPIFSLPSDFGWSYRPGVSLVVDAAHLMPPVGLGVNLAMQDAAEIAIAITEARDWQRAIETAEARIRSRAQAHMREAIPGFAEWFASTSPFAR